MAAPVFYEGQVIESVDGTGPDLVRRGNKWVPVGAVGAAGGATLGAPKLTEAQAKDGFNAKRMKGAGDIVAPLEAGGFDAGLARLMPGFLPQADDKRKYDSAALEWSDSMLRMTTGAAATKEEIDNTVRTYFPQLGDSPEVRRQKAEMRKRVESDALTRAGPAITNAFAPKERMGATGRSMAVDARQSRRPAQPARAAKPGRERVYNPATGRLE